MNKSKMPEVKAIADWQKQAPDSRAAICLIFDNAASEEEDGQKRGFIDGVVAGPGANILYMLSKIMNRDEDMANIAEAALPIYKSEAIIAHLKGVVDGKLSVEQFEQIMAIATQAKEVNNG